MKTCKNLILIRNIYCFFAKKKYGCLNKKQSFSVNIDRRHTHNYIFTHSGAKTAMLMVAELENKVFEVSR